MTPVSHVRLRTGSSSRGQNRRCRFRSHDNRHREASEGIEPKKSDARFLQTPAVRGEHEVQREESAFSPCASRVITALVLARSLPRDSSVDIGAQGNARQKSAVDSLRGSQTQDATGNLLTPMRYSSRRHVCSRQQEIDEYEQLNEPLRAMILSYRVPSVIDYVHLKSKQLDLHRQEQTWQRRVEIAERELHLRRMETRQQPETIIHPWKYLENPSPYLFHRRYTAASQRMNNKPDQTHAVAVHSSLAKLSL